MHPPPVYGTKSTDKEIHKQAEIVGCEFNGNPKRENWNATPLLCNTGRHAIINNNRIFD